jgi:hypothetical protein
MHGIVEALALVAFLGTTLVSFLLRLCRPPKPHAVWFLVGIWPLLWGLASEGRNAIRGPGVMEIWLIATGITLVASMLGAALAHALLNLWQRWRAR